MSISPSRHRRRHTLVPLGPNDLSEGVLVADGNRTVLEVVGGPPFAVLDLFAASRHIGSVTLDHLGSGSLAVSGLHAAPGHGSTPIALRLGGCTVLAGVLGRNRTVDPAMRDRL